MLFGLTDRDSCTNLNFLSDILVNIKGCHSRVKLIEGFYSFEVRVHPPPFVVFHEIAENFAHAVGPLIVACCLLQSRYFLSFLSRRAPPTSDVTSALNYGITSTRPSSNVRRRFLGSPTLESTAASRTGHDNLTAHRHPSDSTSRSLQRPQGRQNHLGTFAGKISPPRPENNKS